MVALGILVPSVRVRISTSQREKGWRIANLFLLRWRHFGKVPPSLFYPRRFAAAPRGDWGKTPRPPPCVVPMECFASCRFLQHQTRLDALDGFFAFQHAEDGQAEVYGVALVELLKGKETADRVRAGLML